MLLLPGREERANKALVFDAKEIRASAAGAPDNGVSNAKLADVASGTLKGRVSANAGDPEDLTAAQVRALLNVADGATAAGAAGDAFAASHAGSGGGAHAVATAGAAGFMTAADKAKLDGIEPAATADQTGAEIVAAINGVLGGSAWQGDGLADNGVSNAKLADVASGTLKGRVSANAGDPEDLTAAQVRALLNVADGATAAGAAGDAFAASHAGTGDGAHAVATAAAAGFMAAADKAKLNAATASPTASTLIVRDANGRAQVANPSAGADIATKSYVDAATAIKLDDLQLPDDNTDLDATTARHGLLPSWMGISGMCCGETAHSGRCRAAAARRWAPRWRSMPTMRPSGQRMT